LEAATSPDPGSADVRAAAAVLFQIILAHGKSFTREAFQMLVEGLGNLRNSLSGSSAGASEAGGVLSVLMQSQHPRFAAAVPSLVAPALETVSDLASGGAPSLAQRGRLWMLIGALRLHLLLPSNGCDPAAKYSHQRDHFEELLADKRLEIEVRETVERLATGGAADDVDTVRLGSDVSDLVHRVQQLASKVVPRPEPPQFGALFEEVTRFTASSARVEKVVSLVNGALSGQSGAGELGVWQGNLGHLIARLTTEYPAYRDVAQPIQLAAYELRYGAALLAAAQVERAGTGAGSDTSSRGGRAELEELLSWLMEFPVTRSGEKLSEVAAERGTSPANAGFCKKWVDERAQQLLSNAVVSNSGEAPAIELQVKVLQLVAARAAQAATASGGVRQDSLEVLDRAFGSLVRLWSEVKEKRAEKEREEAELYKYKVRSHVMQTEEEEAEAGYKEMFPDYFEQYADIEGEPEMASAEEDDRRAAAADAAAAGGVESDASQKASWNLLQELVSPVVQLHNQVFGQAAEVRTPPSPSKSKKGKPKKEDAVSKEGGGEAALLSSFTASYDTGVQLLHHGLGLIAGPEVEKQTASGHLLRVSLEHRRLSRRPNPDASAIDIHSENPPELALALQPLGGVVRRLGVLLAEWPDHPILQQLHKICERVLSLPPSTPVVKALVGLELLLNKAQIWQEGAARHVSLAAELDEVARLVARWRKAELASWPSLLEQVRRGES
jgi:midasin